MSRKICYWPGTQKICYWPGAQKTYYWPNRRLYCYWPYAESSSDSESSSLSSSSGDEVKVCPWYPRTTPRRYLYCYRPWRKLPSVKSSTSKSSKKKDKKKKSKASSDSSDGGTSGDDKSSKKKTNTPIKQYILYCPQNSNPSAAASASPKTEDKEGSRPSPVEPASPEEWFKVELNVEHFKASELKVYLVGDDVIVEATHNEREDEHGYIARNLKRRYVLPTDVDSDRVRARFSAGGVLIITGPKKTEQRRGNAQRTIPVAENGRTAPQGANAAGSSGGSGSNT